MSNPLSIDYIGVSSIFPTDNKKNITTIWKYKGLKQVVQISKLPTIIIVGINEVNVSDVIEVGVDGIATIGVFHNTQDPRSVIQNLRKYIYGIYYDQTNFKNISKAH